jgi:hypothetical protein
MRIGHRPSPDAPVSIWPLALLALPAFVAIWSGWVGLGEMTGFGPVNLLPGIAEGLTINTAITLPIGVEAYAAYALRVWLAGGAIPPAARRFARWSAIGSLLLGFAGQAIYHLMQALGMSKAPWPVVVVVSGLPVAVLGMGAALAHLLRADMAAADAHQADAVADAPGPGEAPVSPWVWAERPLGEPQPLEAASADAAESPDAHQRDAVSDAALMQPTRVRQALMRIGRRGPADPIDDAVIEAIRDHVTEAHRAGRAPVQREMCRIVLADTGASVGQRRVARLADLIIAGLEPAERSA